jgi:hypothetical protein
MLLSTVFEHHRGAAAPPMLEFGAIAESIARP